jgi:hypothetical protein
MRSVVQKREQPEKQASARLARSHAATPGPNLHSHPILHLQDTIGNRAVQRMLRAQAEKSNAKSAGTASSRFPDVASQIPVIRDRQSVAPTDPLLNAPEAIHDHGAEGGAE